MEAIKLSYRVLFSLEFTLEGYRDDINQYLKLVPDKASDEQISEYDLLYRKQKSASVFLAEVEPDGAAQGIPFVPPAEEAVFRFQVKFQDQNFFARTHLASYDFVNQVLVLSNEVNHIEGTQLLLSRPVESYDSSKEYKKGYLARLGSNFFKAIRESNVADAHPVTDTAYWKSIPDGSFVSQADLQTRTPSLDLDTVMVIDIRHSSTLPAAYQLLDASSKCKEVLFKIKFLTNS
ncbi:hypothetical protein [Botryobacter ruber]|uniref:hypothetical protein n=1 Tax=Botryobacter ruber TaxID=2171629 RepID=UPI000E0B6F97|nr:hypothetical protein [Botryobacter ruber]